MTRSLLDHSGTVTDLEGAGGPRPRCMWGELVCTVTPDRFIAYPSADGGSSVSTFCGRHYVLTLAYQLDVHVPHCRDGGVLADHIERWGSLT